MFTSFEHLMHFKGRKVKIFTSSYSNQECFEDTGIITNLVTSLGDNGVFIELDEKTMISLRYIIRIEVLD